MMKNEKIDFGSVFFISRALLKCFYSSKDFKFFIRFSVAPGGGHERKFFAFCFFSVNSARPRKTRFKPPPICWFHMKQQDEFNRSNTMYYYCLIIFSVELRNTCLNNFLFSIWPKKNTFSFVRPRRLFLFCMIFFFRSFHGTFFLLFCNRTDE